MAYLKKTCYDNFYHLKHLGTWFGTWALVTYDRLSTQGFPKSEQEWFLFLLWQIAFVCGVGISLDGAKKIAYSGGAK
jgi:hypothetical protein